ncbi:probable LRR receptor-like serine/threonine-protein kinase At2g16250 [Nymphaea colorata]|nr:probable LRR receptor-like serine/threonine-protein kinase At2g16250 [Nymphaea colorata]
MADHHGQKHREKQRFVVNRLYLVLLFYCCLMCICVVADAQQRQPPPAPPPPSPPPQTPLSSRTEFDALFSLRSSLGLRSRDWPRKVDPCSRWAGVRCQDGHVVGLNISGFKRTRVGKTNPRFSADGLLNLTSLSFFNASFFPLPGRIPEWFGRLDNLSLLDLHSSHINGSIPPSLVSLSNLTVLDLSRNHLTGSIPPPPTSSNLTLLNLSHNHLDGQLPPALGTLRNLRFLFLSNNTLTGTLPPQFGYLPSLVHLDLRFNSLSGSIPVELGSLKNLQYLLLSGNSLSGELPVNVTKLPRLEALVVNGNNLSGGLPDMVGLNLRILDVSSNSLSGNLSNGSLLSDSWNLSSGALFNLSHNLFYGILPAQLGSVLQRSSSFDLSYNYFQGRPPGGLAGSADSSYLQMNCLQDLPNQRTAKECSSFYEQRGLLFAGFGTNTSKDENSHQRKTHWKAILGGVFGALGLVFLVVLVCVLFILKCQKKPENSDAYSRRQQKGNYGNSAAIASATGVLHPVGISFNLSSLGESFSYEQLLQATADFSSSNLIKHGHTGDIYRGSLEGGIPIVVKKIDLSTVGRESYMVELDVFGRASHTRLVPLLGHCLDKENEKFLVYKYMPNGDLSHALHRKATSVEDGVQSLDWITRLKIATGAAEALTYLHHEFTPSLVHRDVQASSILLDDKFEVRLGSLSEVCTQESDSHQSVLSRILRFSQSSEQSTLGLPSATCAYDVYCFGKVLLELVTGKLGISGSNSTSTNEWLDWALPHININEKELVTKIIDPHLIIDEDLLEEVWAMAIVARSCLNPKPAKRPLMRYILKALENPLKVVREENSNASASARLRTTSSRGSWNAALFSSWRHSSSEIVAVPGFPREGNTSMKQAGTAGSLGSGQGGDVSSHKRLSKDIFPEPTSMADIEKVDD